ncbi:YceD family protein [Parasphingorhabdus sp.]|uniref:YceD family protein n=1 Tax=Parasphingorhabdus sp. TaxID=2709688 RepID=UPI003265AAC0
MTNSNPEFSKIIKLSDIGDVPLRGNIVADADQCEALAKRFGIPSIQNLHAEYDLDGSGERIDFTGTLQSVLMQNCAISGEEFPVTVSEEFKITFVEKAEELENQEEIELESDDCDLIEFENARIDIGEAIAQTLYLALEPYPRGPNAEAAIKASGLKSEEEAGPFGALAALKDKLG